MEKDLQVIRHDVHHKQIWQEFRRSRRRHYPEVSKNNISKKILQIVLPIYELPSKEKTHQYHNRMDAAKLL